MRKKRRFRGRPRRRSFGKKLSRNSRRRRRLNSYRVSRGGIRL